MPSATTFATRRSMNWKNIAIATGLSLAFLLVAGLVGALIRIPAAALLLAAAAFAGAGLLTVRLRPTAIPLEPGIGAAIATVLATVLPLLFTPETTEQMTRGQIAISVLVFALFGFTLAWAGARLGAQRHARDVPPHSRHSAPTSV